MMTSRRSQSAVVLRAVATAALSLFVVAGCASETIRNDEGVVVQAGDWSVFDLRPGDCIGGDDLSAPQHAMVRLVPCDQPHELEVFALIQNPDEAYPGAAELATLADESCLVALPSPFGELPEGMGFSYLLPTEQGWTEDGDRVIVCVLVFPDGTAEGSFVAGTIDVETIG